MNDTAECDDCGTLIEQYQNDATGLCNACETKKRNAGDLPASESGRSTPPEHGILGV